MATKTSETIMTTTKKILVLEDKIREHRTWYYNEMPKISDEEFDKLIDELRSLYPESDVLKQVGAPPKDKKVSLPFILGSLDKITPTTVEKWILAQNDDITVSYKMDGISVFALWENAKLIIFSTRGDSKTGQNILAKAECINGMGGNPPKKGTFAMRGEAVIKGNVPPGYKTRRNAVAGIMNRNDNDGLKYVTIYFYELLLHPSMPSSEFEKLNKIELMKFFVPFYAKYSKDFILRHNTRSAIIVEMINLIKGKNSLPFDIDGLVLSKDHHKRENIEIPKYKVALKVQDAPQETKVTKLVWNVTRTSRIVPVVHIDTIETKGVEIDHPTGHNYQWVKERMIDEGAVIEVVRSGDVIPTIVKVIKPAKKFNELKKCPSCNARLLKEGVDLVCPNDSCTAKVQAYIEHFIRTLGAEGISAVTLANLEIDNIQQLYNLTKKEIMSIEGFGSTSADNFISEVHKTLVTTEGKLLAAFGIPGIGLKVANKIIEVCDFAEFFDVIFDIKAKDIRSTLLATKGIGPSIADAFVSNIFDFENAYNFLMKKGLTFTKIKATNKLKNKYFLFTGEMSKPRQDMEQMVKDNGGNITSSFKMLDYLVAGDVESTSSKAQKAREFGVKIINENDLTNLLRR